MKAIISSVSMEKKILQLLEESFTGSARVPYLKTGSRLIRLCVFVSFLAMNVISGMAQTTSGSCRAYVYETPSPPAVYTEIMRDMQENDYTVLYRYVARQMHKSMKNLIFIPIFDAKPTDISDPSSFITGLQLRDMNILHYVDGSILGPEYIWQLHWDSFGWFEKWKFPRYWKIRKQFHYVTHVAVYSKEGTLLKIFSMGHIKPPTKYDIHKLNECPSAKFLLTIYRTLDIYIFFEDACHYSILSHHSYPDSERISYEELYDDVLLTLKEHEEINAKMRAEKRSSSAENNGE
jgi:hypothetical protein